MGFFQIRWFAEWTTGFAYSFILPTYHTKYWPWETSRNMPSGNFCKWYNRVNRSMLMLSQKKYELGYEGDKGHSSDNSSHLLDWEERVRGTSYDSFVSDSRHDGLSKTRYV